MKKIILLVFTFTFMPIILLGCYAEDKTKLHLDEEIIKIGISKSKGFGEINSDFTVIFDDEESLGTFRSIISSSIKEESIVNMIESEFDLEVIYKSGNKQGFHLWLGQKEQKSTLMKIDNTHTIYIISEEMTDKLIDLIK